MNANPASAASAGVSPNAERLQGTSALQSAPSRAPETTRPVATTLETFEREACPRGTSTAFRSTLVVRARPSRHRLTRTFGINCGARRPRWF